MNLGSVSETAASYQVFQRGVPSADTDPGRRTMLRDLDSRDTAILKGLAISSIVLHNFFHQVSPARQNEFTFDPKRFWIFLNTVQHPALAIQAIFSFFGHFGVQVFIFLSAYGLARRHWNDTNWTAFVWSRIKKLYPAFAVVVLGWFVLESWEYGAADLFKHFGLHLALMFLGLSTVLGFRTPPVGPWWFIPFIVQFYALWFPIRAVAIRFGWRGLVVLSVAATGFVCVANPGLAHWGVNLFETPIGRMPGLCFGILAARYPLPINAPVALLASATFLLGCIYEPLWPLTFVAVTVVILWVYLKVRDALRNCSLFEQLGHYSMVIFLVNGIVRMPFVWFAHSPQSQLVLGCLSAAASLSIAVLIQEFVMPTCQLGSHWLQALVQSRWLAAKREPAFLSIPGGATLPVTSSTGD